MTTLAAHYTDFKLIEGRKVPMAYAVTRGGNKHVSGRVLQYKINPTVPKGFFRSPL